MLILAEISIKPSIIITFKKTHKKCDCTNKYRVITTLLAVDAAVVQTPINLSICIDLNTDWNYTSSPVECNRPVTPEACLQHVHHDSFTTPPFLFNI